MDDNNRFPCRRCGSNRTKVTRTVTLRHCVSRTRKCLDPACGYVCTSTEYYDEMVVVQVSRIFDIAC